MEITIVVIIQFVGYCRQYPATPRSFGRPASMPSNTFVRIMDSVIMKPANEKAPISNEIEIHFNGNYNYKAEDLAVLVNSNMLITNLISKSA